MSPTRSRALLVVSAAAMGALAACGGSDSTGPKPATLPSATLTTASAEVGAIASDPTLMALLGPSATGGAAATMARTGRVGALFDRAVRVAERGARLAESGLRGIRVPAEPRLAIGLTVPADFRGKVYALDASETYVATGEAGPTTGLRLMLYQYDPAGTIGNQFGATPIGYAEVTDEGTTNVERLNVKVYAGNVSAPLLSYHIVEATLSDISFRDSVTAAFALTNGKTMAYLFASEITDYNTPTERWVESYEATVPSVQLELTSHIVWAGLTTSDVQTFVATVGGKEVKFEDPIRQGTNGPFESDTMTVKVDDALAGYVIFGNTPRTVRPDGTAMGAEDHAAILDVFAAVSATLDLVGVLATFAFWAIGLGA